MKISDIFNLHLNDKKEYIFFTKYRDKATKYEAPVLAIYGIMKLITIQRKQDYDERF